MKNYMLNFVLADLFKYYLVSCKGNRIESSSSERLLQTTILAFTTGHEKNRKNNKVHIN